MGNREVPFSKDEKCDICGKLGAFDFMGDLICDDCLKPKQGAIQVQAKVKPDACVDSSFAMTDIENLEIGIKALNAYNIEPNIIKDLLNKLDNIKLQLLKANGNIMNQKGLMAVYFEGKLIGWTAKVNEQNINVMAAIMKTYCESN